MKSVKKTYCLFFLITCLLGIGTASAEQVNLIGLDDKGNEISKNLSKNDFETRFGSMVKSFQREILPALNEVASEDSGQEVWEMKTLFVGVALSAGIDLGDTFKASVSPSFYLIFKKK